MLFWLTLILFIGVFVFVTWKTGNNFMDCSLMEFLVSAILGIGLIIEIICIVFGHLGVDAEVIKNKETYKAIVYKIDNGAYEDEFGLLTPSGISEIQKWNEDVVYLQSLQEDFWLGIFVPNVYDQFECIDYTKYKTDKGE